MDEDRISFLQGDFEKARLVLDRLTTRETETIRGLPQMLTVQDLQLVFKLDYRPCLRLIRRYIRPLGGTVKLGVRLYIHPWAVNRLLNQVGRCPECGKRWDGKPDDWDASDDPDAPMHPMERIQRGEPPNVDAYKEAYRRVVKGR